MEERKFLEKVVVPFIIELTTEQPKRIFQAGEVLNTGAEKDRIHHTDGVSYKLCTREMSECLVLIGLKSRTFHRARVVETD